MGKKQFIVIIALLLVAVVGFLAMDRGEKMDAQERAEAFDKKFAK